jgi:hypothetical protein
MVKEVMERAIYDTIQSFYAATFGSPTMRLNIQTSLATIPSVLDRVDVSVFQERLKKLHEKGATHHLLFL